MKGQNVLELNSTSMKEAMEFYLQHKMTVGGVISVTDVYQKDSHRKNAQKNFIITFWVEPYKEIK